MKYILLDIDGVLNPDFEDAWMTGAGDQLRDQGWVIVKNFTMNDRPVWVNLTHGAKLKNLARDTGGQLIWATRWNKMANDYLAPLIGLPELPVLMMPGDLPKSEVVISALGGQKVVWFDDDQEGDIVNACKAIPDLTVIKIDPLLGLADSDIATAQKVLTL